LFYQPIVDADTGRIEGAEALLRWKSDQYGFMSPVEFIPLLEESSLIIPLGRWIIDTAAAQCNEWVKIIPQFVMHINLSFVQIAKSNVIKDVIENINKYDAGNEHFVFEILKAYRWILILR
jgi:EAL domain-containing protein (putative c-di-GMP-specific phosphodiesterase class I)